MSPCQDVNIFIWGVGRDTFNLCRQTLRGSFPQRSQTTAAFVPFRPNGTSALGPNVDEGTPGGQNDCWVPAVVGVSDPVYCTCLLFQLTAAESSSTPVTCVHAFSCVSLLIKRRPRPLGAWTHPAGGGTQACDRRSGPGVAAACLLRHTAPSIAEVLRMNVCAGARLHLHPPETGTYSGTSMLY